MNMNMNTESGYYPPGAEFDHKAPWNEVDTPERSFNVCISQTLSKSTRVSTSDYDIEATEEGCTYLNTSNTDWRNAYMSNHFTPTQLIGKFKEFLTKHLPDPVSDTKRYMKFKHLIKECEGWVEDELEIIKD